MEYWVSYTGVEGDPESIQITADSEDIALDILLKTKLLTSNMFIRYLYEFSVDGFSGIFMDLLPSDRDSKLKELIGLRKGIFEYFIDRKEFAEIFHEYFMVWFPVVAGDNSPKGKQILEEIERKLREYKFPKDMELYIARSVVDDWCGPIKIEVRNSSILYMSDRKN